MKTPAPTPAWYEAWFDSPHYHELYGHRSEAEARDFMSNLHEKWDWKELHLLDLACGKGRHARAAADLGHRVVGLDLSRNSIQSARSDHAQVAHLSFVEGDMRTFELDEKFDGVLNLFTSFGYFDDPADHVAVLNRIAAHLKPGGFLILDFLETHFAKRHLSPSDTLVRSGVEYHISRELKAGENGKWDTFIKHIRHQEDGQWQEHVERVAALTYAHLSDMLTNSGFEIEECFGTYRLDPWVEGETPRIILHATKA